MLPGELSDIYGVTKEQQILHSLKYWGNKEDSLQLCH
jgi:hypothetical protein